MTKYGVRQKFCVGSKFENLHKRTKIPHGTKCNRIKFTFSPLCVCVCVCVNNTEFSTWWFAQKPAIVSGICMIEKKEWNINCTMVLRRISIKNFHQFLLCFIFFLEFSCWICYLQSIWSQMCERWSFSMYELHW